MTCKDSRGLHLLTAAVEEEGGVHLGGRFTPHGGERHLPVLLTPGNRKADAL